jgi:hypothetical protein
MQKPLVIFDIVLHLAATTVNRLIDIGFAMMLEIGHDKTNVFTFLRHFDFTDDAPSFGPTLGLIEKLGISFDLYGLRDDVMA